MNPTHDWQIDTRSMELVIRRDEVDSVGVSLGHDSIDDAHSTTIITSRLIEMILTVQPDALDAHDRAVKAEALREAARLMRLHKRPHHWNLPDLEEAEVSYSPDVWLEVLATRADEKEAGA